ncbi:uncharacterized protein (TIGR02678 family) [Paenibacillus cellulosilyticus]|uniref:Uncharacterized protein (TIGR02678 family) n=1 Tax=Paenibacillus cellulosilyticus TaxID=375489 RepID=A0A2V2YLT8_9BACL|nr:TIGR02678 family protein [Paenibacillus cellulosilyticus]PWV94546.1 uncharacterized protein (TIGR02678 family) [Paenibacillus cellulosilyticus]QKS45050.1 TIGR02678 family protein [Paenibacillus cellulosilyticus]
MSEQVSDDPLQYCVYALFQNYWISKELLPDLYASTFRQSMQLKEFFDRWFRYRLIVEPDYIKLVKTPVEAKPWMGIQSFLHPMDYIFLSCFIAYMEEKGEGQQFVLQDVCEAIINYYPGPASEVVWKNRSVRQSLVRAIKYCEELFVVKTFDRKIDEFQDNVSHDMLFETTSFLRYFVNSFYFDYSAVRSFDTLKGFMVEEEKREGVQPKHRFMRRMFLEPNVKRVALSEDESILMREYGAQLIRNAAEEFDHLELEEYPSMFMMTHSRHFYGQYYPAQNKSSTLSLMTTQLGTYLWALINNGSIVPDETGTLTFTFEQALQIFTQVKEINDHGWSITYQRESAEKVWIWALAYMKSFEFAKEENGYVYIYDVLGRVTGEYEKGGNDLDEVSSESTWIF